MEVYPMQHTLCVLSLSLSISISMCILLCTDKLASRAQRVASYMLNKLGGGKSVQPGDRVALVFRPDEAAQFATAFYGCIFAAVIPVAIEPPVTKEVGHHTVQPVVYIVFELYNKSDNEEYTARMV